MIVFSVTDNVALSRPTATVAPQQRRSTDVQAVALGDTHRDSKRGSSLASFVNHRSRVSDSDHYEVRLPRQTLG